MPVPMHFGKLYEWIEDPQTVILHKCIGENDYEPHTVTYVLKRATNEEALSVQNVSLPKAMTIFHFWIEPLDLSEVGLRPEEMDVIEHIDKDGTTKFYTIDQRQIHNRGQRYRCECMELVGSSQEPT